MNTEKAQTTDSEKQCEVQILVQRARYQFREIYGDDSAYNYNDKRDKQVHQEVELIKQYIKTIEGISVPKLVLPETRKLLSDLCSYIEEGGKATMSLSDQVDKMQSK